MVFSSGIFLYYFLPLFLGVYLLLPARLRAPWIVVGSYVFYGWWRPDFVVLMLVSTLVDFVCGGAITRARAAGGRGTRWLVLSMAANLGLLGYFKYANFGVDSYNAIAAAAGWPPISGWATVVLPVGISFYTFQTMSYTIDLWRGVTREVDRFVDFMAYVALFPQLVAGPIVRYATMAEQLRHPAVSLHQLFHGVLFFQAGLAKKLLVADPLGALADGAFGSREALAAGDAWLGAIAYSFQIYFDFSGYSDMAIGLGLMLGFRFPVNFEAPYRSIGITDFWRRWHISLSTWLRDYLYISIGGNRLGRERTYANLLITMLLGGLWHGAAWTFVVWGAYHGAWLVLERALGKRAPWQRLPAALSVALTFVVVVFGWVLFRAEDLGHAAHYASWMVGLGGERLLDVRPGHLLLLAVAGLVVWTLPTTQRLATTARPAFALGLQPIFLLSLLQLHYQDHVPFLYFAF